MVQPFISQPIALYASQGYVDRYGQPSTLEDYPNHRFVGMDDADSRAPFARWLRETVPDSAIVFRSGDVNALRRAIAHGAGIGFISKIEAEAMGGLIQIHPPRPEWTSPLWLVTHMDLHRTAKVQTFLTFLKQRANVWDNT